MVKIPTLVIILIFVVFPIMDVYFMISWVGDSPFIALPYWAVCTVVGLKCLKLAGGGMRQWRDGRREGQHWLSLFYLMRLYIVGLLLVFPGYISDILALLIFLLFGRGQQPEATNRTTPDEDSMDNSARPQVVDTTAEIVKRDE